MQFERKKRNIVWICIDGLRGDSFMSTGNNSVKWNYIDDLITTGVFFPNSIAAAQSTIPSSASFFTSMTPDLCRLPTQTANCIPHCHPDAVTIADILKHHGYRTYRWDDMQTYSCHPKSGFDVFEGGYGGLNDTPNMSFDAPRRDDFLARVKARTENTFLYMHLDHLHEYGGESASVWTGEKYLMHVREVAAEVESIVNKLALGEDDILLINSDHGVTLNQDFAKFEKRHGGFFGEGRIRVFTVIHCKDFEPMTSPGVVGNIDLAPTLLDMVGIEDMKAQGKSLLPVITDGAVRGGPISVQWTVKPNHTHVIGGECPSGVDSVCLRDDEWKYTVKGDTEVLVDLRPGAEDLIDVKDRYPEQAKKYDAIYRELYENSVETPRDLYATTGQTFDKRAIRPDISVLLPVFRMPANFRNAFISLIDQIGYFEILILDGDDTGMVASLAEEYDDDYRIRRIPVHGMNLGVALNKGVAESRGQYIATVSANYRYSEDYLYLLRRELEANDSARFTYCDGYQFYCDPRGKDYSYMGPHHFYIGNSGVQGGVGMVRHFGVFSPERLQEFNCIGDNGFFTRDLIDEIGGFVESASPTWETWKKMVRSTSIFHMQLPMIFSNQAMVRPVFSYPEHNAPNQVSVMVVGDEPDQLQSLLASLNAQTMQDFEVVMAADRSRLEAISKLADIYPDMSMQLCITGRESVADKYNSAVSQASGKYLVWCPSGAMLPETYLADLVEAMETSNENSYVSTSRLLFKKDGSKSLQGATYLTPHALWLQRHDLSGVMYQRSLHDVVGKFHGKLGNNAMWDMALRIAEAGAGTTVPDSVMLVANPESQPTPTESEYKALYQSAMRRMGWSLDLGHISADLFAEGNTEAAFQTAMNRLIKILENAPHLMSLKPRIAFCGVSLALQPQTAG